MHPPRQRPIPMVQRLLFGCLMSSLVSLAAAAEYGGVRVIAHRGAGFEFDENTLEACRQSYERGIRGYEIDVRMTRDGQLVLMHDADVSRTTEGEGRIEELTLEQIRPLRTRKNGVAVPTAQELFRYFSDKPDVYLMLEMKTGDRTAYPDERVEVYCQKLLEAARTLLPKDSYCFISFDTRALAAIRRLDEEAFTGYLSSQPPTEEILADALRLGSGRLSVPIETTTRQWARKIRDAGLQLSLWPIRTQEDADLAVLWKASILCTDTPSELLGIAPATSAP